MPKVLPPGDVGACAVGPIHKYIKQQQSSMTKSLSGNAQNI